MIRDAEDDVVYDADNAWLPIDRRLLGIAGVQCAG